MKDKITKFFRHDRTYKTAVKLYHEHGNKISLKKRLNVEHEDEFIRAVVFEELRELAQIPAHVFKAMMTNPVLPLPGEEKTEKPGLTPKPRSAKGKNKKTGSTKAASKSKSSKADPQKTVKPAKPAKKDPAAAAGGNQPKK